MDIFGMIGSIFNPVTKVIDSINAPTEAKMKLKAELAKLEHDAAIQMLGFQTEMAKAHSKIVVAENASASVLARNWRPVTMLTFLALILLDSFGLLSITVNPEVWQIMKVGLIGYGGARSVEKVIPGVANMFKKQ